MSWFLCFIIQTWRQYSRVTWRTCFVRMICVCYQFSIFYFIFWLCFSCVVSVPHVFRFPASVITHTHPNVFLLCLSVSLLCVYKHLSFFYFFIVSSSLPLCESQPPPPQKKLILHFKQVALSNQVKPCQHKCLYLSSHFLQLTKTNN